MAIPLTILPIISDKNSGGIGITEGGINSSSTSITVATYRTVMTAMSACSDLQLIYANQLGTNPGTNSIQVRASVVIRGTIYPITFAGSRNAAVAPNAYAVSDRLPIALALNEVFYVLSSPSVTTLGQTWPLSNPAVSNTGDGFVNSVDATDTNTGINQADAYGYGPVAVYGTTKLATPSVGLIGDSIISGNGDSLTGYGHMSSWATRACIANNVGWARISIPGEGSDTFNTTNTNRLPIIAGLPVAICAYGVNGVNTDSTFQQMKDGLALNWQIAKNNGAKKVFQSTITPGDQTGSRETIRTQVNTWLRSGQAQLDYPAYLDGIVDAASKVESLTTGGAVSIGGSRWALDYQSNQLHPSPSGHAAMSAALTNAQLRAALIDLGGGDLIQATKATEKQTMARNVKVGVAHPEGYF